MFYSINMQRIDFYVGIMRVLTYTIVDFHLLYDETVELHIWALPTRSQCKVSDTQVTVKVSGPLVVFYSLFLVQKQRVYMKELEIMYPRSRFWDSRICQSSNK